MNLLAVNRQTHSEAVGIFYDANSFEFWYPTQLHAFLLSLGPQRQSFIRDITLWYSNTKSGGIDLVDLTFPLLQTLPGLRRLHVLFDGTLRKRLCQRYWPTVRYTVANANPAMLPGIRFLFRLRRISDIKLRDTDLEKELEKLKEDKAYPEFPSGSKSDCLMKLERILEHFNTALSEAQNGKVNKKMLDDDDWHLKDVFPTMDDD